MFVMQSISMVTITLEQVHVEELKTRDSPNVSYGMNSELGEDHLLSLVS